LTVDVCYHCSFTHQNKVFPNRGVLFVDSQIAHPGLFNAYLH